ncbi:MAG: hypothetical protein QXH95_03375 [Thermoplasmata archaeon]
MFHQEPVTEQTSGSLSEAFKNILLPSAQIFSEYLKMRQQIALEKLRLKYQRSISPPFLLKAPEIPKEDSYGYGFFGSNLPVLLMVGAGAFILYILFLRGKK